MDDSESDIREPCARMKFTEPLGAPAAAHSAASFCHSL
jgi:hypothetical protein